MASLQPFSHANCSSQSIPHPIIPGARVHSLEASPVHVGWLFVPGGLYSNNGAVNATNLDFCNVTITYIPQDSINQTTVQVWLPEKWNGRMQGLGGGGWSAGLYTNGYPAMTAAAAQGYASISTNGGYKSGNPSDWALLQLGKVDYKSFQHFASTSLNDLAIIGKSVVKSFYGTAPKYSYWNGCSQGGRQGFMLAQRYPKAFDGIVASAPAVNWGHLLVAGFWAQMIMNEKKEYPRPCELSTITAAAVKACDGNDGVIDGLVSDPDSCHFDPYTLVNTTANCWGPDVSRKISPTAAYLAKTLWGGLKTSRHTYMSSFGMHHEAPLVTGGTPLVESVFTFLNMTTALADSDCRADGTCFGKPFSNVADWIRYFVKKNPAYDLLQIDQQEFDRIFEASIEEYNPIIGTDSRNLTSFRDAGGKILSYHGLVGYYKMFV
jgi:hypothetical protein